MKSCAAKLLFSLLALGTTALGITASTVSPAAAGTPSISVGAAVSDNTSGSLTSIACGSATSCYAVGWVGSSSPGTGQLVSINDGAFGTVTSLPTVSGIAAQGFPISIACSGATQCYVGGGVNTTLINDSTGDTPAVLTVTNGTPGTASTMLVPKCNYPTFDIGSPCNPGDANVGGSITDIACPPGSTTCVVIGAGGCNLTRGYLEAWTTSQVWVDTVQNGVPAPLGAANCLPIAPTLASGNQVSYGLNSVACTTSLCYAVGHDPSDGEGMIIPVTGGLPGTPVDVPGTYNLTGISCTGGSTCVAVGQSDYTGSRLTSDPAAVNVSGGSPVGSPVYYNSFTWNGLTAAGCTPAECVGAGSNGSEGAAAPVFSAGLILSASTSQASSGSTSFGAVTCPTPALCIAVGTNSSGDGVLSQISLTDPEVTSVQPSSGPLTGQTSVDISGVNFASDATVAFCPRVGGPCVSAASATVNSSMDITAVTPDMTSTLASLIAAGTLPSGTASLTTDVVVTNPGPPTQSSLLDPAADGFIFQSLTVTNVSPSSGPAAGGQTITVTGSGFMPNGTSDVTSVQFCFNATGSNDDVNCTPPGPSAPDTALSGSAIDVTGDSSLTVVTPDASADITAGPLVTDVQVTTTSGASSPINPNDDSYAFGGPNITNLSQQSSPLVGGQALTVTGSGFGPTGADDTVDFVPPAGGTPIPCTVANNCSPAVLSDSTINLTIPDVTSYLADGQSSLTTYVQVTDTADLTSTNDSADEFVFGFAITNISPSSMSPAGGNTLTVTGAGFGTPSTDALNFYFCPANSTSAGPGCAPSGPTTWSDSSASITAPALTSSPFQGAFESGNAPVVVFADLYPVGGGSAFAQSAPYTYSAGVSITSISPSSMSPAGGNTLTVTGAGFGTPSTDHLNFYFCVAGSKFSSSGCADGGSPATWTDSSASITAPALPGLFQDQFDAGNNTVVVFADLYPVEAGSAFAENAPYNYSAGVSITNISPSRISPAGGVPVTVTGAGFGYPSTGYQLVFQLCPAGSTTPDEEECVDLGTPSTWSDSSATFTANTLGGSSELESQFAAGNTAVEVFAELLPHGEGPASALARSAPYNYSAGVSITNISPPGILPGSEVPLTVSGVGFGTPSTDELEFTFCPAGSARPEADECESGFATNWSDRSAPVIAPALNIAGSPLQTQFVAGNSTVVVFAQLFPYGGGAVFAQSPPYNYSVSLGGAPPSCGALQDCQGSTNTTPGNSAVATSTTSTGSIIATATGTGGVTVGRYSSNPVNTPAFSTGGSYFDVAVASPNTFTSLTVQDCDLGGGTTMEWWNGASWQTVSPTSGPSGSPSCLTATLNATTSNPTISQLSGTVFAVGSGAVGVIGTPSAPISLDATPGPGEITLDWSPPLSDGGAPVTGYEVFRWTAATTASLIATVSGTSYVDTDVSDPTYFYDVEALNVIGSSPPSDLASATPSPGSPAAPTPPIAPAGSKEGYWLVGSDGGIFSFGDAAYEGSVPGDHIHVSDIVGMVATPDGAGYWLVGSDGGIFSFGDAAYEGSVPGDHIHVSDIVGMVATPDGAGYWLVGSDGGIFSFGDAAYEGSVPALGIHTRDVIGMAESPPSIAGTAPQSRRTRE